jgi:hypothetical protein
MHFLELCVSYGFLYILQYVKKNKNTKQNVIHKGKELQFLNLKNF